MYFLPNGVLRIWLLVTKWKFTVLVGLFIGLTSLIIVGLLFGLRLWQL
jgi:hypothetical protein